MITILPALPVEQKPIDPRDNVIDLVSMKRYGEWLATQGTEAQHEAYHFGDLTFQQRHDIARAWALQRDHEFDTRRGEYFL